MSIEVIVDMLANAFPNAGVRIVKTMNYGDRTLVHEGKISDSRPIASALNPILSVKSTEYYPESGMIVILCTA